MHALCFSVADAYGRIDRRRTPRLSRAHAATLLCELAEAARTFKEHVNALFRPTPSIPGSQPPNGKSRKP